MTKKIGRTIRDARITKGLSQAELAAKVGVSPAAVGHWERGTFTPKGKNINALSDTLGIALQPDLPLPEFDEPEVKVPSNVFTKDGIFTRLGRDGKVDLDQRSRAAEFEYSLISAMEEFENTTISSEMGGPKHDAWEVDLMSDRTVIEVKHAATYQRLAEVVERALWRLSFLKAFFGDHLLYVAIVRRPPISESIGRIPPASERAITRLAAEADLVGIHFVLVDTPEEAVQAIRDLEKQNFHTE